jgi:hypothetical protein
VVQHRIIAPGVIKCRVDATGLQIHGSYSSITDQKMLKFRIEIVRNESNASELKVQFIHNQGSFSTFQTLVNMILVNWSTEIKK